MVSKDDTCICGHIRSEHFDPPVFWSAVTPCRRVIEIGLGPKRRLLLCQCRSFVRKSAVA